jgi:hypothetical protein
MISILSTQHLAATLVNDAHSNWMRADLQTAADTAIDIPCKSKYQIEHALIHDYCHDHLKFERSRGGSVGCAIDVFVVGVNRMRAWSLIANRMQVGRLQPTQGD